MKNSNREDADQYMIDIDTGDIVICNLNFKTPNELKEVIRKHTDRFFKKITILKNPALNKKSSFSLELSISGDEIIVNNIFDTIYFSISEILHH